MLESEIKRLNPAKYNELVSQDLLKTTLKNVMTGVSANSGGRRDRGNLSNESEKSKTRGQNPMKECKQSIVKNSQIQHAALNQAMERIYAITESNPMS